MLYKDNKNGDLIVINVTPQFKARVRVMVKVAYNLNRYVSNKVLKDIFDIDLRKSLSWMFIYAKTEDLIEANESKVEEKLQVEEVSNTPSQEELDMFRKCVESGERYEQEHEQSETNSDTTKAKLQAISEQIDSVIYTYTRTGIVSKGNNETFMRYSWDLYENDQNTGARNFIGAAGYDYNHEQFFIRLTRNSKMMFVDDLVKGLHIVLSRGKSSRKLINMVA